MKPTWIRDVIELLSRHVPEPLSRAVVAAALIAIGLVVAWLLGKLAGRLLKGLTSRVLRFLGTPTESEHEERVDSPEAEVEGTAASLAARIVFWFVFAFFVGSATSLLGFPVIGAWLTGLTGYLPRILAALAVLLLGVLSARILRAVVAAALRRAGFGQAAVFSQAVYGAVVLLAAVVAVQELGIGVTFFIVVTTTVLAAALGGVALAFGLGARDTVSNLVAAHYLSRTLQVGNRVRLGEHEGEIVDIQATTITLDTAEGQVLVPARFFHERTCILLEGGR